MHNPVKCMKQCTQQVGSDPIHKNSCLIYIKSRSIDPSNNCRRLVMHNPVKCMKQCTHQVGLDPIHKNSCLIYI
jgi:hypothetical protein